MTVDEAQMMERALQLKVKRHDKSNALITP